MRMLVTGAAGFIGSNLCRALVRSGHDVVAQDRFAHADWRNLVDVDCDVITFDLADGVEPLHELEEFDAIFHQASITDTTVTDQHAMMRNNVEAFRHLLDFAAETESRVVWASSASVYGRNPAPNREDQPPNPLNVYAFSKLQMERLARRTQQHTSAPVVALRYFNVYGPGEDHKGKFASMIHQIARQMRAGQRPRLFTAGQQRRDFVHVDDVVSANLLALKAGESGVYNVGSGKSASFNEVVAHLNRVLGLKLEPEYFENPYGFTQDLTEADLTRSQQVLGYEPQYDIARGIDAYFASGQLGMAASP